MLIHRRHHDVQHAVPIQVAESRRGEDPPLHDVVFVSILRPGELRVRRDGKSPQQAAGNVPGIDLPLEIGGYYFRGPITVDIAYGYAPYDGGADVRLHFPFPVGGGS